MPAIPADYVPNKIRAFIESVVWAKPEYLDAMTMALAVSHARYAFTTIGHVLATSDQPASGKSTIACDIPVLLADNPWKVGRQTTEPALTAKYTERTVPSLVADDVGKIFGDAGTNGKTTKIYAVLIDCYRNGATTSMARNGVTQDVPTYGMAFMNGLHNAVPKDLATRSIHLKMEGAPPSVKLRDALDPGVAADAKVLKEALHGWAASRKDEFSEFMQERIEYVHPKLTHRKRQIWGPLFAAAFSAGGDWPRRIRDAFVSMALDEGDKPTPLPEQKVLLDTAEIIMKHDAETVFVGELTALLRDMPDGQYYRDVDNAHLKSVIKAGLGEWSKVTGKSIHDPDGKNYASAGYQAAPILEAAADLRDALYPPMEIPDGPNNSEFDLKAVRA